MPLVPIASLAIFTKANIAGPLIYVNACDKNRNGENELSKFMQIRQIALKDKNMHLPEN